MSTMPEKEQSTGPPGRGFCTGPTTQAFKNLNVTETATRNSTSAEDGLSESSPRTRMTADCEATRNSANRRIRMTGSGQSQEEATP